MCCQLQEERPGHRWIEQERRLGHRKLQAFGSDLPGFKTQSCHLLCLLCDFA